MKELNEKQWIMFFAENGCSKTLVKKKKKAHRQFLWLFFFNPEMRKGDHADILKDHIYHAIILVFFGKWALCYGKG